jgi:hypothetical protein
VRAVNPGIFSTTGIAECGRLSWWIGYGIGADGGKAENGSMIHLNGETALVNGGSPALAMV